MTTTVPTYSPVPKAYNLPERTEPSLKEKALVDWVYAEYHKMKNAREHEVRKWTYNLTMYDGKHYLTMQGSGANARLTLPQAPPYRVRSITNRLRPIIRTEIARLVAQRPSVTVVPATGEDEDTFAALAGEQLWESIYYTHKLKRLFRRNAFWISVTGNGFIKLTWDKRKRAVGQEIIDPLSGQTRPAEGDLEFTLVTPFHIFVPDLLEEELENQPYVFQIYTKPVVWARKHYNLPKLEADCVEANEILDSIYFNRALNQDAKPDSVLVIEAWIKPGSVEGLPDGGVITCVGRTLISNMSSTKGMPYSHEQYPFAHFVHTPTGKFYGISVLEDLNSLQKEYNNTRNQIIESKRRMARPQLLVPKGTMNLSKVTSEPGALLEYNPAFGPPTPLPLQPIPQYVLQELDVIKADMEDISGQHQVTRGNAPGGGVTAATAIGFLQEKDDSLMSTVYDSVEDGNEKLGRQSLALCADFFDIPRLIKITGTDGAFNVIQLKGADISNGLDLRVEGGSALPTSKAAKQALLMDLFTQGAIAAEDLLSLLDMGGVSRITDRLRVDRTQAQRENLKFKNLSDAEVMQYQMEIMLMQANPEPDPETGLPLEPPAIIPVNEWDNHVVHIQVHNDYRKGTEFEMLPEQTKLLFDQHVKLHMLAASQMAMPQVPLEQEQPTEESQNVSDELRPPG